MKQLGEVFSKLELESARDLLNVIVPSEPLRDQDNSFKGKDQTYSNEFDGSLMRYGVYNNCQFMNVNFVGTVGKNSVFVNSLLDNCNITDANFSYSNFANSRLIINASSSTYDFSDFSDATISKSTINSSSFKECYFCNSKLSDTKFQHCEFTNSTFKNCLFEQLDFSMSTLDFSEIINSKFNNVILPFFGVLNLVSGFGQVINQKSASFKPASSNYIVNGQEYIENVRMLKAVFYYEKNFLALANIYTYDGEIENAYSAILNGLQYACSIKNFELIHHLCRFASINNYFNRNQLKKFYEFLGEHLNVEELGYVEYRNYLNELYLAKSMLIDCPFNRDVMEIELKTNFGYSNIEKLSETFRLINATIEEYAPDSNNHITIRHNSPADFSILLSGDIYTLYIVFIALQIIFCKSLNGVEKIQNIIKNGHEIKLHKLDEQIKALELEKLKADKEKKDGTSPILLPDDFKNITYIVKTANNLPTELRKM